MDKLISLQDAIKAIDEKAKRIKNEDTLNGLAGAVGILFDLPSVNPQPCEDAIRREDALKLIYDFKENHTKDREKHPINYGTLLDLIRLIRELPSVKSQETGHWIFEGNQCFSCSSCGRIYTQKAFEYLKLHKDDSDFPNNCPNCGTKMVEPQERSE